MKILPTVLSKSLRSKIPDFRKLLSLPVVYSTFSHLLLGNNNVLVNNYICPRQGERILDIGCGPGDIVQHLPKVDYTGFDMEEAYIASAITRYGRRGKFVCQTINEAIIPKDTFDIVLAIGVVHHLSDEEAIGLFRLAQHALKPGGRLITVDGCTTSPQNPIARYLLSIDRGEFVRDEAGYRHLASKVFSHIDTVVRTDLLRIPYTHMIGVMYKD